MNDFIHRFVPIFSMKMKVLLLRILGWDDFVWIHIKLFSLHTLKKRHYTHSPSECSWQWNGYELRMSKYRGCYHFENNKYAKHYNYFDLGKANRNEFIMSWIFFHFVSQTKPLNLLYFSSRSGNVNDSTPPASTVQSRELN